MAQEKLGDKAFKKGKQCVTKSIFNWSKDYAMGASYFDEALKHYQTSKSHEKCLQTLMQLIVCNSKNMDNWAVARNHQTIVDIYLNNYPNVPTQKLTQQTTQAFVSFRMAQSIDKGLSLISRVTKFLINRKQTQKAVQILHEAYKISNEAEKSFKKNQIFNLIVQTYIQNGLYSEAEKLYIDQIKLRNGVDCQQFGLIIIILILIQNQPKRAEKQMYQISNLIPSFLSSHECEAGDNLINYYKNGKVEQFQKQTTRAAITTIFPIIIIQKLRKVVVPSVQAFENANTQKKEEMMKQLLF